MRARRLLREGALTWGPEGPLTENCVQPPCLGPRLSPQLALPQTLAPGWLFDCIHVKHRCMCQCETELHKVHWKTASFSASAHPPQGWGAWEVRSDKGHTSVRKQNSTRSSWLYSPIHELGSIPSGKENGAPRGCARERPCPGLLRSVRVQSLSL